MSDSESEEKIVPPSEETEPQGRGRSLTSTEPVAEDEGSDKTAGKSRAGQTPDFQGWLKKRGDQGRIKLWRKRHFRLYRKEGVMAYFKSDQDTEQLGEVRVTGAFLIDKRDDLGKFVFTITMKTTARVWILQASDEATLNQWITACTPLMKETAQVRHAGEKKPPKPANGLPLPYPPTYVQGFSEREECSSIIQSGADDWTKLSHTPVVPVQLAPGQVAIALYGSFAAVEEVREANLDGGSETFFNDLPKQLKYSTETVGWSSADSQLLQTRFQVDEKTQRDFLRKVVGQKVTASVPGTGAGHNEDSSKRAETRLNPPENGSGHSHNGTLAFPNDAKFTGKLVFDEKDERYALVDEATNSVHFLNTKDAHTIHLNEGNVSKLNVGTSDAFVNSRLWARFQAKSNKTQGQLTYRLKEAFDTHINYVVTLNPEEKTADVQGWYSVENKTSKTYKNAVLTVVPDPKLKVEVEKEEEKTVADVAAEEGKKEASKKGFGAALAIAGSLFKKDEVVEEKVAKTYRYPVVQKVTLPSYDWAHAAFLSQNVQTRSQHLITFDTPKFTIKPMIGKEDGVGAEPRAFTVVRFSNPLKESLPGGVARINRRDRSGLGVVRVADVVQERVEGGEIVTLELEKTVGVRATRVQTGYNFDAEKHFIIETFEITVVNTRQETVNVTIEDSLFRWNNFEITSSRPAHSKTAHPRRISWEVRLNHGEDQVIRYTAFYSSFDLESDYERN
jgi:hypothetical protein